MSKSQEQLASRLSWRLKNLAWVKDRLGLETLAIFRAADLSSTGEVRAVDPIIVGKCLDLVEDWLRADIKALQLALMEAIQDDIAEGTNG